MKDKKQIIIENGDGSELDISPVYNHIDIQKPSVKVNKDEIVIPEEKED